ncbi:MAG: pilus assembly protein PilM [bacterium]
MGFFLSRGITVGIDISDRSIEIVGLEGRGKKVRLAYGNRVEFDEGLVEHGRIVDRKGLHDLVEGLLVKSDIRLSRVREVVFGLPERQSYLHVFSVGSVKSNEDRGRLVQEEMSRMVPLPFEEVLTAHAFRHRGKSIEDIVAVSADRAVVSEWQDFFSSLGVDSLRIVPETAAVAAALLPKNKTAVCVADLGARVSSLFLVDSEGLHLTHSFPRAGNFLTKLVAGAGGLTLAEAEKVKMSKELGATDDNISDALLGGVMEMAEEIKTFLAYASKKKVPPVGGLILVGGTSLLRGLPEALSMGLKIPVSLGCVDIIPEGKKVEYAGGISLASVGLRRTDGLVPVFAGIPSDEAGRKEVRSASDVARTPVTETSAETDADSDETKKLRKQKIILGTIVVCGIMLISIAILMQSRMERQRESEMFSLQTNFSTVQRFELSVSVAVSPDELTGDRVAGRIFSETLVMRADADEAVAFSRINAGRGLKDSESVWAKPVSVESSAVPVVVGSVSETEFTVSWLVYDESAVNAMASGRMSDGLAGRDIKFAISNVEKLDVSSSDNPNVYVMTAAVSVALEKELENFSF